MIGRLTSAVALVSALTVVACGGRTARIDTPANPPSREQLAELWVDPGTGERDLFWGIGGREHAPPPKAVYALKEKDDGGFSVSFDVEGPDKLEWSAKIGPEAQAEVVVSRILWGLGYHQPPIYYLPRWQLGLEDGRTRIESEARFRPKLQRLGSAKGYWRWADNPFLGAVQMRGLLVVLLILNSSDLKDDNNSIYEPADTWDGAKRWFLVRDVGASLGETGKLFPRRNWLEGFERHGFITGVSNGVIQFDYRGRHEELLTMITAADVRWAASRLERLTDKQWRDAFRAGNYAPPMAERYIQHIRKKIAQGASFTADAPRTEGR